VEAIWITLWWDDQGRDWNVEINGHRHLHVTSQSVEDLVEAAVITAERAIEEATIMGLDRPN
jgi:hypothetical protein